MTHYLISILPVTIGLLTACSSPQPNTTSDIGSMQFFSKNEAGKILAPVFREGTTPTGNDPAFDFVRTQDQNHDILARCGIFNTPIERAIPAALIGWGIGQLIQWTVRETNDQLKSEIKKYSTTATISSEPEDFYQKLASNSPTPGTCFRVSRVGKNDDQTPTDTLLLDYIGIVSYDPKQPEIITFRPVRLFVQKASAKTSDGKVALALKITSDAIYRNSGRGMVAPSAIDTPLVSEILSVDVNGKIQPQAHNENHSRQGYLYIVYEQRHSSKTVPLPPWTTGTPNVQEPMGRNKMTSTIYIVEVGNISWLMKNASELLDKNKDDVARDLIEKANEALKN